MRSVCTACVTTNGAPRNEAREWHHELRSAAQCHPLPTRSFAECLQRGFSERLRGSREIAKALQTSVNRLVDRSGFEPLTSAVQIRNCRLSGVDER
jgi:hypothetical protein